MLELYLDFGPGYVGVVTTGAPDERDARNEIVNGGAIGAQLRADGAVLYECRRVGLAQYSWRTSTMAGAAVEPIANASFYHGAPRAFSPSKVKR